jgi:hypothetical protein
MYFQDSSLVDPTAVHTPVRGVSTDSAATEPSVTPTATVWERFGDLRLLLGVLLGVAGAGSALIAVAHWPAWMLLGYPPVVAMAVQAQRQSSPWRMIAVGLIATALVGLCALGYFVVRTAPKSVRHIAALSRPPLRQLPWTARSTGQLAVRELAADDEGDVWGIANATTLVEFDGASLNQLGVPRHFDGHLQHLLECEGYVLATYGAGELAEVGTASPSAIRHVNYGHPVNAGPLTGMMACGSGSVFVAMPLEAKVVRIAVPDLRIVATISVGKFVSGLAYAAGVLYVEDATQAAVITVNLTSNLPWRWTATMPDPKQIVGLRGEGTLLTHGYSSCLGYVHAGARKEQGQQWSIGSGVRALAIGPRHGALLNTSGLLYRFDAETGEEDALPIQVPRVKEATTVVVTTNDRTVLAIPTRHMLVSIQPDAWSHLQGVPRPAGNCLTPSNND